MYAPSSELVPPPHTPSSGSECVSPLDPKVGEPRSFAVEGVGGPNEDDWIEGLVLCVLSGLGSIELKEKGPSRGRPELGRLFLFLEYDEKAAKLRWVGGAQRPVWRGNEPKKTGARSARARTRGQNPLVLL